MRKIVLTMAAAAALGLAGPAAAKEWIKSQADYEACEAKGGKVTSDAGRGQSPQLYCAMPGDGDQSAADDAKNAEGATDGAWISVE